MNSSAIQLADLGLAWSAIGSGIGADLVLIDSDLASDRGLKTAVMLSLFTDRRADNDDVPPSGNPNDRRGWWADEFAVNLGDLFGSRLWLLDRSVLNNQTVLLATEYVNEALQWMIDDHVVASITPVITPMTQPSGLTIGVTLQQPGADPVTYQFSWVWNNLLVDS